jgi:hypothetical protein
LRINFVENSNIKIKITTYSEICEFNVLARNPSHRCTVKLLNGIGKANKPNNYDVQMPNKGKYIGFAMKQIRNYLLADFFISGLFITKKHNLWGKNYSSVT